MSEFKFACPVCGQRMAVDSSATGAQVECPTCFQIVIVPKAPVEGSKYQLSATQFIKPVILPPPKPAMPAPPQRKSAVLIFGLILACAALMAMFVREKIVGPQRESAKAGLTNAVPVAASPLWTLDLTNAVFPDEAAAGKIHGHDFVCRQAVLLDDLLALRSGRDWQAEMAANLFLFRDPAFPRTAAKLSGRTFEIGANQTGSRPAVSLVWRERNMRITETFTNGFAMKLEFGSLSGDKLPGKIYLCLPDETKSYVVGTFTAEVSRP